jgi:hypothetical protein
MTAGEMTLLMRSCDENMDGNIELSEYIHIISLVDVLEPKSDEQLCSRLRASNFKHKNSSGAHLGQEFTEELCKLLKKIGIFEMELIRLKSLFLKDLSSKVKTAIFTHLNPSNKRGISINE